MFFATCYRSNGNARFLVGESPQWAGKVEQERLADENEGDPLVVTDVFLPLRVFWYMFLFYWQVVSVLRPTHLQQCKKN